MVTSTSVQQQIIDALTAAGVSADFGPLDEMPANGQAAVLWPAVPSLQTTRMSGGVSGKEHGVTVLYVGRSVEAVLAVADKGDAALVGLRLTAKGGHLTREPGRVPIASEPNSDPKRYQAPVSYRVITKG